MDGFLRLLCFVLLIDRKGFDCCMLLRLTQGKAGALNRGCMRAVWSSNVLLPELISCRFLSCLIILLADWSCLWILSID
jgi:hypothetical protein